jgi:threonine synthase
MMRVMCSDCSREVPVGTLGRCPVCGGILRPDYDDEAVRSLASIPPGRGIGRYWRTLPVSAVPATLGEGDTPLLESRRISLSTGLQHLYFKNEGLNPSGAFKDRAGAMTAALALAAGAQGVVTASSGNASSAISAYCAAAGLKCVILMEPGNPTAKLRQTLAAGAKVLLVEGIFAHGPEALAEFLMAVAQKANYYLGFVWAPINPYILEGIKTISYEIAAALQPLPLAPSPFGVPNREGENTGDSLVIVGQVGGGDMFAAQWRGWKELQRAGVIEKLPRMIGVQSVSAPPLLKAFESGAQHVATLPYANSKISGINVPFTGDHALNAARESGGAVVGVTDEEVFAMQRRMAAEEGIWVEPAGAAPVAALPHLLERGLIVPEERVVCILSGAGFKDTTLAADQVEAISQQVAVPFDAAAAAERMQH